MLRPLLEEGQQIRVECKGNKWKKRHFLETDVTRIEKLCEFENFNKTTGFLNTRKSTRKTTTFYNVIVQLSAVHTQRFATKDKPESQSAVFKITVASLNPLATTVFPPEFERTSDNMAALQRYLGLFPVRLHRQGYEVSEELRGICKAQSKKRRREIQSAEGSADPTTSLPTTTASTSASSN